MPPPEQTVRRTRHPGRTVALAIGATVAALVIAAFIFSFFLDGIVRSRTELAMNRALKGYHATVGRAHLQLVGGVLRLYDVKIIQQAHPRPPVADFPLMRFRIEWTNLLLGRAVADVRLAHPQIHVNEPQLEAERRSATPIRRQGWQRALENVYPFRINRFEIDDADITYIQDPHSAPLHMSHLNLVARNIRNIHSPRDVYPSTFHFESEVFGTGKAEANGRANFLMRPFPGVEINYRVSNVPLGALTPEIRTVNLIAKAGTFGSSGHVEYAPKVTSVRADDAEIDGADVTYVHTSATSKLEAERARAARAAIEAQNNRAAVNIRLAKMRISNSRFAFDDKALKTAAELYMDHVNVTLTNVSNHRRDGDGHIALQGDFMGTAKTVLAGTVRPTEPAMDVDYGVNDVALDVFTPEIQSANLAMKGGRMESHGHLRYSPKLTAIRVHDLTIDKLAVTYFHSAATRRREVDHITETGNEIEKENNRSTVYLDINRALIRDSNFSFADRDTAPGWKLYLADADLTVSNLSNHQQNGLANLDLRGRFMGSGIAAVKGVFLPAMTGPEFNMNCVIRNTRVTALNPLLKAYGRMEVAAGLLSLYAQIGVRNDVISGYVKPLFADLKVYSGRTEKGRGILHKAKEMAIGVAADILKNPHTREQATIVDVSGRIKNPDTNTWQAVEEVLRNAFVKAILPGFDQSPRIFTSRGG